MISLFRKIRKSLMEQNKIRTYILYAIGEVALVMIGILLALQVNNWNEQRKTENLADAYLRNVQQDLLSSVEILTYIESYIARKDSLFHRYEEMLAQELNNQSIDTGDRHALIMNMTYPLLTYSKNGYNQLLSIDDKLSETNREILKDLTDLYRSGGRTLDLVVDQLGQKVEEESSDLVTMSWYFNWSAAQDSNPDTLTAEFIDYALNDPMKRNRMAAYHKTLKDQLYRFGLGYGLGAKMMYKSISKQLGDETLPDAINILPLEQDMIERIQGRYVTVNGGVSVNLEYGPGGVLQMKRGDDTFNLYQTSATRIVGLNELGLLQYESFEIESDSTLVIGGLQRHNIPLFRAD